MRIAKSTLIGTAVAVALCSGTAFAQQSSAASSDSSDANSPSAALQAIVVTGIRYEVQRSLQLKRMETGMTEVATAESIGKLPDKNVADVLSRLPGVDAQSSVSGEGGFADNNRISLRGTPASLTQTTIDGHAVSSGDWFIEDQYQTVGRSVSYDLLPANIVSKAVVHLSQNASMMAGGVAGSVNIHTVRPFDFKPGISGYVRAGAVYADLPGKTDPQASAMVSWRNDRVGLLAMGFYQKQHLRRDGQEFLGYAAVPAATAQAWRTANPALPNAAGALYPTLIGQALFQQNWERAGGLVDLQLNPTERLSFDLTGFYSHLDAANTNRNFMLWGTSLVNGTFYTDPNTNVTSTVYAPSSLTVANGAVLAGTWPTTLLAGSPSGAAVPPSIVYDQIMRPGATASSSFVNLDGTYDASDDLTFKGQIGFTYGRGNTPSQPAFEYDGGSGAAYQFHGITSLATVSFPGVDTSSPNGFGTSWAWNDIVHSIDKESYGKLDATLNVDNGAFKDIRAGIRFAHHERETAFNQDQGLNCFHAGCVPAYSGGEYPSDYQSSLPGGGAWANNIFINSEGAIQAFDATNLSTGAQRYYWQGSFDVNENDFSAYLMANVGGERWSGNFGVRFVNTLEEVLTNVQGGANPLTFSAFGPFTPTEIDNRYFNVLPSANFKFDITKDLLLRFDAAETIALPDYSALGGAVLLTDTNLTGNGGNPNLKPVKGAVYSTDLEYYYGPESMFEIGLFDMDMSSYVDFGTSQGRYYDMTAKKFATYSITSPFNTTAQIRGGTLSWQQALPFGFGVNANFTLADGTAGDGNQVLGDSKYTYNVGGYYQHGPISANLDYTYRSHYYVAVSESSPENMANWDNLDAEVNYTVMRNLTVSFTARNLTDEIIKYYGQNEAQPVAIYNNGRRFYLTATYKF